MATHDLMQRFTLPGRRTSRRSAAAALLAAACVSSLGASPPSRVSPPATAPDEALWADVRAIAAQSPAPGEPLFAAERLRRERLLDRVLLYQRLYPGGLRRDEAIRLELVTRFELGCMDRGELAALCERVAALLRTPPSRAAEHEAAYWAIICERRGPVPDDADAALSEAHARYVARYPDGRYAPRFAEPLVEAALARGDLPEAARLVSLLEANHPGATSVRRLRGSVRRAAAIGQPLELRLRLADGSELNAGEPSAAGRLIVVWAAYDPRCAPLLAEVRDARQSRPALSVVGVNLDPARSRLEAACQATGIDWPHRHEPEGLVGAFALDWAIRELPAVFVIGRDGRLAGVAGPADWRALAEQTWAD